MKRLKRVYVEITNVCNLHCSFCSPMRREPRFLSRGEFASILEQVAPYTGYLYFHVKGEPLLHPQLGEFLDLSGQAGFPGQPDHQRHPAAPETPSAAG